MSYRETRRRTRALAFTLCAIAAVGAVALGSLALRPIAASSVSAASTTFPTMTPALIEPTVVFIGGAVAEGAGANGRASRWTTRLALDKGWNEVNLASASNIAVVPADKGCVISSITTCSDYRQIVVESVRRSPGVVVVSVQLDPSGNAGNVGAAVGALLAALRTGLPNATIIAVGPSPYPRVAGAGVASVDQAVRAAATSARATYVSLLSPPVLTSATVSQSGDTPTNDGHAAIAAAVGKAIP